MPTTQPTGKQIRDATIQRVDLDVSTAGQSVITKLLSAFGISLTATGADAGTGDVTASVNQSDLDTVYGRKTANILVMSGGVGPEVLTDQFGDYITTA